MPLKPFQENYWNLSDTTVAPVVISQGGYPAWQSTIVASLWGTLWEQGRTWLQQLWWSWRVARRARALSPDRQGVLMRVFDLLEHPAYPHAQTAVRTTATTLGFASPQAWVPYSRMLKSNPGRAENLFRHVRACELTRAALSSTVTNPTCNLIVELAYADFERRGV